MGWSGRMELSSVLLTASVSRSSMRGVALLRARLNGKLHGVPQFDLSTVTLPD